MDKFLCYDQGTATERDGHEVYGMHAGDAAQLFAEDQFKDGIFAGDMMVVMVKEEGKSVWVRFEVTKHVDFVFSAWESVLP